MQLAAIAEVYDGNAEDRARIAEVWWENAELQYLFAELALNEVG